MMARKAPLVRSRWPVLAALVGALAAGAVWGWPAGPLWRSGPDAGHVKGFSPDGGVVVTVLIPESVGGLHPNPVVSRWDTATGALLSRAEMACADPQHPRAVRPSADGRTALVAVCPPADPDAGFSTGPWYLHDGVTGQRRLGPIPGVMHVTGFSPDGRWFGAWWGDPRDGSERQDWVICSADTGRPVLKPQDWDDRSLQGFLFAPDGETVALVWLAGDGRPIPGQLGVQVVELPSGRERRRVELPPRPREFVQGWDGRYLQSIIEGPEGIQSRGYVFDLAREPVGDGVEDPLPRDRPGRPAEERFWAASGPDWVAYLNSIRAADRATRVETWWDAVAGRLGLRRTLASEGSAKLWIVDRATGATRYETRCPVHADVHFTSDGRRLAYALIGRGVEVWDTAPPPRWPVALAAGLSAAAGTLALGLWRRRAAPSVPALANSQGVA